MRALNFRDSIVGGRLCVAEGRRLERKSRGLEKLGKDHVLAHSASRTRLSTFLLKINIFIFHNHQSTSAVVKSFRYHIRIDHSDERKHEGHTSPSQ
jgi:hypothetical protein